MPYCRRRMRSSSLKKENSLVVCLCVWMVYSKVDDVSFEGKGKVMKWPEKTRSLWQHSDQTQDLSWPVNLECFSWHFLWGLCVSVCGLPPCYLSLPAPSRGLRLFKSILTFSLTLKRFLSVSLSLMEWNNGIKLCLVIQVFCLTHKTTLYQFGWFVEYTFLLYVTCHILSITTVCLWRRRNIDSSVALLKHLLLICYFTSLPWLEVLPSSVYNISSLTLD